MATTGVIPEARLGVSVDDCYSVRRNVQCRVLKTEDCGICRAGKQIGVPVDKMG